MKIINENNRKSMWRKMAVIISINQMAANGNNRMCG
jgi:hypothetical protein